jgi:hypothetical protein
MNLAEMINRICEAVGDPAGARYSDAVVTEGLRLALEEYSRVVPQILETTITVTTAGRDQELNSVGDCLYILAVLFPVTSLSAPEVESYYAYFRDGAQRITISAPAAVPAVGDEFTVQYGALQTVENLDLATATTIPQADYGLVVQGAAGHAMHTRADSIVESYGQRTKQDDAFQAAARRLADFRRRLKGRKGSEMPLAPWGSATGWKLDRWDSS